MIITVRWSLELPDGTLYGNAEEIKSTDDIPQKQLTSLVRDLFQMFGMEASETLKTAEDKLNGWPENVGTFAPKEWL